MTTFAIPEPTSSITEPQPSPSAAESQGDCLSALLFTGLLGWTLLVAYTRVIATFLMSATPGPNIRFNSILLALGQMILLGLPLIPLALLWKNLRYRAVFQTWAMADLFTLFMLPVFLSKESAAQLQAVLHIALSVIFIALVVFLSRRKVRSTSFVINKDLDTASPPASPTRFILLALLISACVSYPWLAWGAFGSLLDTMLELTAALAIGSAAAVLIERFLLRPFSALREHVIGAQSAWQDYIFLGLATGAALLILASSTGFAFGGMQLLLMIFLPALGWSLAGIFILRQPGGNLADRRWSWLPAALLIGLSAAAPLTLIDPDELILVISIGAGEILQWAFSAAGLSLVIALVFGLILFVAVLVKPCPEGVAPASSAKSWLIPVLGLMAAIAWVVGAGLYLGVGQPGFYGENMFVILRSQPDVSNAASIADYTERRRMVYNTLVENADTTQAGLRQALDRMGVKYTPFYLVNGMEVPGNPLLKLWLESRPEVDRVLDNPQMRPLPQPLPEDRGITQTPPAEPEWNLTSIGANRVWKELGVTGKGIVVGQSDSGVQGDHPELADSYRGRDGQNDYNWYDPWNGSASPVDIMGHGTHTMGSVAGNHTGVAPDATWIACVNLARNLGNPAYYLDCMQFMLAPFPHGGDALKDGDPARGAQVINNSWGCPDLEGCDPDALLPAVRALRDAGIFVEASAGNDGPACSTVRDPIALYGGETYSTGAINESGQLANFSGLGPVTADGSGRVKPDIVAPGVDVFSALPGSTYGTNSGTSMAGPHVVGVVALMWSANPSLIGNIDRTQAILDQTAQPYRGTLPNCPEAGASPSTAVGYGVVDAYQAVKMAQQEGK